LGKFGCDEPGLTLGFPWFGGDSIPAALIPENPSHLLIRFQRLGGFEN